MDLCSDICSCLIHVHSFVFHYIYPSSVILPIGFKSVKMFSASLILIDVFANGEYTLLMRWNEPEHNSQHQAVEFRCNS